MFVEQIRVFKHTESPTDGVISEKCWNGNQGRWIVVRQIEVGPPAAFGTLFTAQNQSI